jgi:hypothetical protein
MTVSPKVSIAKGCVGLRLVRRQLGAGLNAALATRRDRGSSDCQSRSSRGSADLGDRELLTKRLLSERARGFGWNGFGRFSKWPKPFLWEPGNQCSALIYIKINYLFDLIPVRDFRQQRWIRELRHTVLSTLL